MGSKSRIAKDIVPIIQKLIEVNKIDIYIEPFVGGANVIDKIQCKSKIGNDKHEYLIALFKNLDKVSELPEFIDKEHYSEVRNCFNKNAETFEDWYIGAVGFLASYNGRFFDGGYAGLVSTKTGKTRNYYDEAKRNLIEQLDLLQDIEFINKDYSYFSDVKGALIYCDPPYFNTKQYGVSKNFSHDVFWEWVRIMSVNNIVIVSEVSAPDDFISIWDHKVKRTIDNTKRVDSVEKLYLHYSSIKKISS